MPRKQVNHGNQSQTVKVLFLYQNLRRRNRKKVIIWHVKEKEVRKEKVERKEDVNKDIYMM